MTDEMLVAYASIALHKGDRSVTAAFQLVRDLAEKYPSKLEDPEEFANLVATGGPRSDPWVFRA
ncbi:hypothetical protein AAI421_17870 [Rhodococcus aetherivorans]|uniref:hypothetical protein n=1 Tax=Rhodococcus aetherivorans TaxID=191292 RepID=UPI0031D35D65